MANSRRMTSCSLTNSSGGKRRVHHRIGKQFERDRHAFGRNIDPINRAIERRIGVDIAAGVLDALGKLARRPRRRSLEKHVLEHVRQPRAEVASSWMLPVSTHDLHARDRRAMVFLHDDAESVRQRPFAHRDRREIKTGTRLRWWLSVA